mgnify:FL=1
MITASFSGVLVDYIPVQTWAGFARVKDSIELYGMDRQSFNEIALGSRKWDAVPLPDVFRYRPSSTSQKPDYIRMDEPFQHWLFRVNVESFIGRRLTDTEYQKFWQNEVGKYKADKNSSHLILAWNRLLGTDTAFTNRAGYPEARNYIAQEGMEFDYPKLFHLTTGRFVGKLAHSEVTFYGYKHTGLECINISDGYLHIHPFTHPHLFTHPIVTGRYLDYDKGGYKITGYFWRVMDYFNSQVVIPFALPFDDIAYMPTDTLVIPSDREPGKP